MPSSLGFLCSRPWFLCTAVSSWTQHDRSTLQGLGLMVPGCHQSACTQWHLCCTWTRVAACCSLS